MTKRIPKRASGVNDVGLEKVVGFAVNIVSFLREDRIIPSDALRCCEVLGVSWAPFHLNKRANLVNPPILTKEIAA
jgi:hypothetical protein